MRHPLLALGVAMLALVPGADAAPAAAPQVVDISGDANFVNGQGSAKGIGQATPAGSQDYADVTSVLWKTTWKSRKVGRRTVKVADGFTVTTTLTSAAPPPSGTTLVYRMLGTPPCGNFFGVVYYTTPNSDPKIPQSAVRDDCTGETRLSKIALPVIKDNTMTWTVKFTQLPREVKPNALLADLRFEVREIETFPACLPDDGGITGYGGACGLGVGQLDEGSSTKTFKLGS